MENSIPHLFHIAACFHDQFLKFDLEIELGTIYYLSDGHRLLKEI